MSATTITLPDGQKVKVSWDQFNQYIAGFDAMAKGDVRSAVAAFDAIGQPDRTGQFRAAAMDLLSKQTVDPFDDAIKASAFAQLQRVGKSSRQSSFVTGPRGLEGPLSNSIFGGGTSLMGR